MNFSRAIARVPGNNFENGITSSTLGKPDLKKVNIQHRAYLGALESCGLSVTLLNADENYPDSTFVEDTAVMTSKCAILTRPGAQSRRDEVGLMRTTIESFYPKYREIKAPGTLEGGDVCQVEGHFFVGLSERTNEEGACQLAAFLAEEGFTTSFIPLHATSGILHLKTGMTYIGENTIVVNRLLDGLPEIASFRRVVVNDGESYAANCVRINDSVLIPSGFPKLQNELSVLGFKLVPLDMSEFRKMDGGLSCLSLRF